MNQKVINQQERVIILTIEHNHQDSNDSSNITLLHQSFEHIESPSEKATRISPLCVLEKLEILLEERQALLIEPKVIIELTWFYCSIFTILPIICSYQNGD